MIQASTLSAVIRDLQTEPNAAARRDALALLIALAAVGLAVAGCGNLLGSGTGLSCVVQKDGIPSCFGAGGTPSAVDLPKGYAAAEIAVGGATVCIAAGKSGSSLNP